MTDIKPFIAEKLSAVAPVELSFTRAGKKLPVICISETGNSAEIVLGNRDRVSRINIQLDIYADSAEETERLAIQANEALTSAGLRRAFSQLFTEGDCPRRCMRFSCGVDEADGRILRI